MNKRFNVKKLTAEQKNLRRRILEISAQRGLSHMGSCLSASDIISAIYSVKKPEDKFILSNGHAAVAWYAVLEKLNLLKARQHLKLHIHPDRNLKLGIEVSTGSLGQGLPIAVGMAFANPQKTIYCLISDGECAEGSIWEALRIAGDNKLSNLRIVLNANGWGAYDKISLNILVKRLRSFNLEMTKIDGHNLKEMVTCLRKKITKPQLVVAYTSVEQLPFLKGQDAHYYKMTPKDFDLAMEIFKE